MSALVPARIGANAAAEDLLARGFVILKGVVDPLVIERLDADLAPDFAATPSSVGPFYGTGTVRFGRLLTRSRQMQAVVLNPVTIALAEVLLRWHRGLQLDFTQAIAVAPGTRPQAPHRDGEMWPLPRPRGEHLVNVILPLTTFSEQTGATQVWAMSHRGAAAPTESVPTTAAMMPGDALVFLGSTLHRQGANTSEETRRAVVVGYSAAWLKPSENQTLSYPPAVARDFPHPLARLIGYERIAPNLNNYDCRCPSELLGSGARGAVDRLHPEQVAALKRHFDVDA